VGQGKSGRICSFGWSRWVTTQTTTQVNPSFGPSRGVRTQTRALSLPAGVSWQRYAAFMTVDMTDWEPDPDGLPDAVDPDHVYLLPAATGAGESRALKYREEQRMLPKYARANNIPLAFAKSGEERIFLSEFSADVESLSIALAAIGWINDWTIAAVTLALAEFKVRLGRGSHEMQLNVSIAELRDDRSVVRGLKMSGDSASVLEALRILKDSPDGE
jgi:hypothetical protein